MTQWEIHGSEFGNCNCAYGCPCQFNALPTYGDCRAITFFQIDKGHHGETKLDGTRFGFAVSWPGPVHGGKGEMQPYIDESASDAQRQAIMSILTGKDTDQAATVFWVYSAMCDKIHDPVFTPVTIKSDMSARSATCEAKGVAKGHGKPIKNPMTGKEHHVGINSPKGFEFRRNECGSGTSTSTGAVAMELKDSYAFWCEIHMNGQGVIAH